MAFASNSMGGHGFNPAEMGPELSDVATNEVGFKSISGDCNVRLLPTPWPADTLPPPTSALLGVASTKGVVVGAGPDCLAISRTEDIRKAISAPSGEEKIKTKPFEPQSKIPLPARPTHVAFCSGDNALLLAVENGAQVSIYETESLLQPNAQPGFSIPTNGVSLRGVFPNPAPPPNAHSPLVALVTMNGDLLIANLQARDLVTGPNGPILKNGVSCVSWSNKGKQLVAGLGDGTLYQMAPDGARKDEIPRPPDLEPNCHVSSILWLENDVFLIVYTPNSTEDDMGSNPPSSYYIVTRRKQAPFMFQKLPDLCLPFGMKRTPAYQFIARMRNFKPHLEDLLILASTASTDVGLITRSDQPLSDDDGVKQTTGLFTTTEIIDDTKRAEIPLTEAGEETSVIGFGLDLSSTENVVSPIPGEEIAESSTPLPNLLLLNNDGILSSWWFVYSDSIRQKMAYHGLSTLSRGPQQQPQQPAAFGTPSPFGAQLGFGTPSALGGNRPSTFGTPSALGGGPVLGPSVSKPSFGTPSPLGRVTPQFGQSGFGALGQTPSLGQPSTPGFGSISGGGFGSYAKGGGFASLAPQTPGNLFGKPAAESPFSKLSGTSPFGLTANKDTAFTPQKSKDSTGFGLPPGGFVLGSTLKGDGSAVNDGPKPEKPSGMFTLGGDLDEMVSTPTKASPPTEAMDDMEDESTAPEQSPSLSKEPTPTSLGQAQAPLSGAQMKTEQTASAARIDKALPPGKTPFGGLAPKQEPSVMGLPLPPDSTSKAVFGPGDTSASSNVSKSSIEDAPLPPDFLTQPKPAPKSAGEPPLPPDFVVQPKKTEKPEPALEEPLPPEPSPKEEQTISQSLPEDDESEPAEKESGAEEGDSEAEESESEREAEESDFADSGEEITREVSPTEEEPDLRVRSLKTPPESSFGGPLDKSPGGDLFSRISKPEKVSQLFGEVKPHFLPVQKAREVPRSPSPVRAGVPGRLLRPEGHRSISVPSVPGATLAARKAALTESAQRDNRLEPRPSSIAREEQARYVAQARREAEEMLSLSDDDEDERLRSDLARPVEPVPTLDPLLPHQDYTGGTSKPGVPGQIEKLYRDINSMVDTLGINSRSLMSYLLYQQMPNQSNYKKWENILLGDQPTEISEEKLLFVDIEKLDALVSSLAQSLDERRVKGVEEKLKQCGDILSNDILTLRAQCAGIQRILDTHTNPASILSTPLSAEQVNLQQDLRSASTIVQAKLAELEQGVSLLRARIADAAPDPVTGVRKAATKRPTIEAVSSTIATMMGMAEAKSGDIDILEAKMKKLGIDISGPSPSSREGSPFTTPKKALGRVPVTPGSRGSRDEAITTYHTPDSASRGLPFRSSINGSARASRLRNMQVAGDFGVRQEGERWKEKAQRRRRLLENLKHAMDEKKSKVRGIDDP